MCTCVVKLMYYTKVLGGKLAQTEEKKIKKSKPQSIFRNH